jgi:hypothetical protein
MEPTEKITCKARNIKLVLFILAIYVTALCGGLLWRIETLSNQVWESQQATSNQIACYQGECEDGE